MSATETVTEDKPRTTLPVGLILSLVLAAMGGTGGFFAVRAGILPVGKPHATAATHESGMSSHEEDAAPPETEFVSIDPMVVSIGYGRERMHLKFRAELEVNPEDAETFRHVMPRILDMLNGYLRALEPRDLEDPLALLRIRSQLLRRINLLGDGKTARNLLIVEFVVN
ncbi:flagellar basal body-associated FliL family protein [Jhaorihella thermophila]|uniref:Flagellar protein FliL n=1 Tax=Jhaorihella thermophila TaxID=488547 RepID=A0A1H5XG87_9RHOB|nr:flagellar basal body-associated FliL family protein [Jhaorihella thermophila]SEG10643.1 flagellar FliL protein [Jhaorihella thermophila]